MSIVYEAEDLKHHRKVAVKVLRPELTAALGTQRFLREIDVAAHLQHPNILPLFDSGELEADSGIFYYVMPLVDGESLRSRLDREKHLPIDDAIRLTVEVADALNTAHANGVVHRDIKPENILLVAGHAIVADFGIACAMTAAGGDKLTATGLTLGSPHYMSPERVTESAVDGRADIYSLACVAYEMLAATPPFTGASAQAVMARHSVDNVPSVRTVRPSVSMSVEKVLMRALAKVPTDRYPTASEFGAALKKAALEGEEAHSAHHTRRRAMTAALGATLVALPVLWLLVNQNTGNNNSAASKATLQRLAVLSFANLSSDTTDAYLARGISEEIASRLSDFRDLKVASRSTVDRIERADAADVIASATKLGFGYLVEGSVRRASEGVRVVVRLVDVGDGDARWNRTYDRPTTDLLALQDEIALDVVQEVVGHITPETVPARSAHAPDPSAHDQLLQGKYYMAQRNPRSLARAVEAFTRGTVLDPKFALAYASLAQVHVLFLDWGWTYDGLPPDSLLARGWKASERAIALEPQLADGWIARGGLLRFRDPVRLAGVRETLQHAVELSPGNAEAHHEFGMNLRLLQDDAAASAQFRQALAIEPDRPMSLVHLGWIDMIRHRYADAQRWLDSAAGVNPGFYQAYVERASLRLVMLDTAGARADAQTALRLRPSSDPIAGEDVLVALSLQQGDTSKVRSTLARLRKLAPKPEDHAIHQAIAWASLLVAAGQHDEAISFLQTVRVDPTHLLIHLKEPRFDALISNPRFQQLKEMLRPREARAS